MPSRKLLLVSANKLDNPYPVYPLAIAYLTTHLKSKLDNFEIHTFDFILNNEVDFVNTLRQLEPDYVGISIRNVDEGNRLANTKFIDGYDKIVNLVKSNTNSKLIIGGSGFSIFPEIFFNRFEPDFAVYGEGEKSTLRLLLALENNSDYEHIEGLVFRKNGKIIVNPKSSGFDGICLNFDSELVEFYWKSSGMLNVQTKRGCPYNCIYCSYPLIEGKNVRTLDAEEIVNTLKELYHNKGIDYVFFTDSVFNIRNDFNIRLAEKIIDSGINLNWGAFFSPHNLDFELLKILKKSGLSHVEFGTESLSDKQLENYGKQFSVADVIKVSDYCLELRIFYAHYLIIGGYGETEETIEETIRNSVNIQRTVYFPYFGMRIYPGTKLHQLSIQDGIISEDDDLIIPKYYISNNFDVNKFKEKAIATGKRWLFPDEELSDIMLKIRAKERKGPLWEYLRI